MPNQVFKDSEKTVRSFMVSEAGVDECFGDILSKDHIDSGRNLKIGMVATGYFEFWHQYPELLEKVEKDAKVVYDQMSEKYEIVYSGIVDTIDKAVDAGKLFCNSNVDVIILEYRTYIPDIYIHHMLTYVEGIPLIFFASQDHEKINQDANYCEVYRNSGMMAQIQLVAGFKKMGSYKSRIEVIAGSIYDSNAYKKIDRYIDVLTIFKRLKHMTIGVIGNVFRGMFDFEYDRTKIKGILGPEVMNVSIEHLIEEFDKAPADDAEVHEMVRFTYKNYTVTDVGKDDIEKASRLAVAFKRLVNRFRLDGIAMLGQHFVEKAFKTEPFLAINELDRNGKCLGVTEGDVIGLITMKIMQYLSGNTPFQFEYSEFDIEKNAMVMLGHGHGDPKEARNDKVILSSACEHWGHEGTGVSSLFVPKPGTCTFAHFIEDAEGWRIFVYNGEILDLPPLPINEVHAVIKVDQPVLEFTEKLVKAGLPHHAITVRGDIKKEMLQLAELMGISTTNL